MRLPALYRRRNVRPRRLGRFALAAAAVNVDASAKTTSATTSSSCAGFVLEIVRPSTTRSPSMTDVTDLLIGGLHTVEHPAQGIGRLLELVDGDGQGRPESNRPLTAAEGEHMLIFPQPPEHHVPGLAVGHVDGNEQPAAANVAQQCWMGSLDLAESRE